MIRVGFTGTRKGMTEKQKATVKGLLTQLGIDIAHHGGCVGADTDFDDICGNSYPRSIITVIHPSNIPNQRGVWHFTAHVRRRKNPLERNKDIVNAADFMIATPGESVEVLRSGTWATIRYARKAMKPLCTVFPDGSTKEENSPWTH